jgi:hypothetical protein
MTDATALMVERLTMMLSQREKQWSAVFTD